MIKSQFIGFVLAGLISGVICGIGGAWLPEIEWLVAAYPGVILGLCLFLAGKYLTQFDARKNLSASLVIVSMAVVGWRLAVKLGAQGEFDDFILFALCGVVGATCVAIGLIYAWSIRSRPILFAVITIAGGGIGGVLFQIFEKLTGLSAADSDLWWSFSLFTMWQTTLFASVSIALSICISPKK